MSLVANILLDWKLFLLGIGLLASVSIINTTIPILPVGCLMFMLCSVSLWFTTICVTFVLLHKLLQKNEPIQFGKVTKPSLIQQRGDLKPNQEKVKLLSQDIEEYFISKWYINISEDDDFPQESRLFLEEVISRFSEVQLGVNNKVLLHGMLNIYLKHLKEFRRTLIRKEKYEGSIEDLYRYSHFCTTNLKSQDYFIHQLTTNLLRHFINSDLWNSLPCQVLVSVLARKLTAYLLNLISNPEILNYLLLDCLASKAVKEEYNLSQYSRVCILEYYDVIDAKGTVTHFSEENLQEKAAMSIDEPDSMTVEKTSDSIVDNNPIQQNSDTKFVKIIPSLGKETKKKEDSKNFEIAKEMKGEISFDKSTSNSTSTDPVKIYEAKFSRTTKTYSDSKELALGVSLGQDPLDAMPVTMENVKAIGKSIFWDSGKIEQFVEEGPTQLLNEVKHTTQSTMEGLKSSIKPISDATVNTLHNIKDLQETTVNNALHKIGDFQDEAAGMVEGILDFGRAGLRKGLRLTGLQDNIETAKASQPNKSAQPDRSAQKSRAGRPTRAESPERGGEEADSVWMNPLQMDSPNFDGQILLVSSLERPRKPEDRKDIQIPSISTEQPPSSTESPDPEYEDTADLASSIAKLRSLLQQRSSESSLSTPALSPIFLQARYNGTKKFWVADRISFFATRPPDDFMQKSSEAEVENISDLDEVDGVMPSFYKFCAKTATGVLDKTIHTIKTALPSNIQGVEQSDNAWIFIQTDQNEADILTRMKKLLTERKEYCTLDMEIDTAYEAIDSSDTFPHHVFPPNVEYEDELDEFEAKLPVTKALLDIVCELLAEADSPFVREPLVKAILLTFGNTMEHFILSQVDAAMDKLCVDLIVIPKVTNQNTLSLEKNSFVEAIFSGLPDAVKLTFGKSTLTKAFQLLVSSLQSQKINQDVVLQIFELFCMKLIEESSQLSPPASA
ncbi:unnamed protein product [Phaedon cochleariae]|uniref:PXA domain-containing protein n=1 Tax=Phaedon cochleariae TaxID=80249 RepID=A0A9P0GMF8_PHACE|nr:unnamed protein product [Phaedon cochleariae]